MQTGGMVRGLTRSVLGMALLLTAAWLRPASSSAAPDAVLDAKRKGAAQLLRDNKPADALTLLREVVAVDDTLYSDHLLMARACDKLGQGPETMRQYHRVIELLPASPANTEERTARQEADKKLKVMDPLSPKIDAAEEEFFRKLDSLEREAIAARNMAGLERLFRIRGMLWQAKKLKDRGYAEVFASGAWQNTGIELKEKQSYRVRAAGTWHIRGLNATDALIECTAAGTQKRKEPGATYLNGQLEGQVNNQTIGLGEDMVFVAPASGTLQLIENDGGQTYRVNNQGSLHVLIIPQ